MRTSKTLATQTKLRVRCSQAAASRTPSPYHRQTQTTLKKKTKHSS